MTKLRDSIALCLALAMLLSAAEPVAAAAQQPGVAPEGAKPEETTGAVRGTLIDANGQPLAGYFVKVVDKAGQVYESQPTGSDGKYEIVEVPAGTYTFQIFDPTGNPISARIPPVTLEAGTILTQPIAIVPHKQKKGALIAWLVGGGITAAAIAVAAANNDDNDGGNDRSMSPGGGAGAVN